MKRYQLTTDPDNSRHRTLFVITKPAKKVRLPLPLNFDQRCHWPSLTIATALLLDHFAQEHDCELKARVLARAIVPAINRLGDCWTITEETLNDWIMSALVDARRAVEDCDVIIDEIIGQRRDTLRHEISAGTSEAYN